MRHHTEEVYTHPYRYPLGGIMSESKAQTKPDLTRAKAILREQWPEVLQYLGDRSSQSKAAAKPFPRQALDKSIVKS
jgi:hypothetical protein